MSNTPNSSLALCEILALVQDCITRTDMLRNMSNIKGGTKNWINTTIYNRLNAVRSDISSALPGSDWAILKQGIMNDDSPYQLQEMRRLFMMLTNEQRNEIENTMLKMTEHLKK